MKKSLFFLSLFFSTFLITNAQNALESCDNSSIVCESRSLRSTTYNLLRTDHGYVQVGPANSSFAHFNTDRPKFYFNKDIYVRTGGFNAYSGKNLYLKTNGTTRLVINQFNGNTGIGVSSTQKKLDVGGDVKIKDNLYLLGDAELDGDANLDGKLVVLGHTTLAGNASLLGSARIKVNLTVEGNSYVDSNFTARGNSYFYKDVRMSKDLKVLEKVAIGTDILPGYSLAVCGKIRATEVKVNAASEWCDYVFEEDYDLRDLSEVDAFIKENKHLPEIPSAKVVDAEGIEVSAMMILMMKKIEELTLYTIEQEKRINQLEKNN
tara:strand:+ start:112 stop:1074 length:963 start_codon:yes stop_codon:yes gene_type:complete